MGITVVKSVVLGKWSLLKTCCIPILKCDHLLILGNSRSWHICAIETIDTTLINIIWIATYIFVGLWGGVGGCNPGVL